MKLAWIAGIALAFFVHVVALYGGVLFPPEPTEETVAQVVDLLGDLESEEKEEEEKEPEPSEVRDAEVLETESESPPDATEIVRALDASLDDGPALEAASLADIEAALSGQAASGDFADAIGLASGGRIGASGSAGFAEKAIDDAFSLAELDQEPRAILQGSPVYPAAMRGKKLEGAVTVLFVVDAAGKVENARAESSSHEAFESPALAAVRKWKFEPGLRAGQRVSSKMRISIRFPAN